MKTMPEMKLMKCAGVAYIIFLSISLLTGCNENPVTMKDVVTYNEPSQFRSSTFPFAVGNQWVYADSFFTGPSASYEHKGLRTSKITGYTEDKGVGWWTIDNFRGNQDDIELTINNDSIYYRYPYNDPANFQNNSLMFIPAASVRDTITFFPGGVLYPDDTVRVFSLGHPFETPAGAFDSVFVYIENAGSTYGFTYEHIIYFRSKVGIIYQESRVNNNFGLAYQSKSTLLYYSLYQY